MIRFTVQELARVMKLPKLIHHRIPSSLIAVILIGFFALLKINGAPAGLALWALFGTSNQLLAGIALLVATLYFFKRGKPTWFTFIPMVFMLVITSIALFFSLEGWVEKGFSQNYLLIIVGSIILLLLVWLVVEATISFILFKRKRIEAVN